MIIKQSTGRVEGGLPFFYFFLFLSSIYRDRKNWIGGIEEIWRGLKGIWGLPGTGGGGSQRGVTW